MKSCAKIHKFGEREMLSTYDYIITIASYKTIDMMENTVYRNNIVISLIHYDSYHYACH